MVISQNPNYKNECVQTQELTENKDKWTHISCIFLLTDTEMAHLHYYPPFGISEVFYSQKYWKALKSTTCMKVLTIFFITRVWIVCKCFAFQLGFFRTSDVAVWLLNFFFFKKGSFCKCHYFKNMHYYTQSKLICVVIHIAHLSISW